MSRRQCGGFLVFACTPPLAEQIKTKRDRNSTNKLIHFLSRFRAYTAPFPPSPVSAKHEERTSRQNTSRKPRPCKNGSQDNRPIESTSRHDVLA